MRRKICFGLLLVCSTIFGSFLSVYSDVNAFSFDYGGWAGLTSSSKMYGSQGNLSFGEIGAGKIKSVAAQASTYGQTSSLNLCLSDTIPAGSVFSVSSKWAGYEVGTSNLKYPQVQLTANSYDYSVITNTYGEYGSVTTLLYTDVAVSGCGLWFTVSPVTLNLLDIEVLPINWVKLNNSENWTQAEKTTLFNRLNDIAGATSNTSSNIVTLLQEVQEINDKLDDTTDQEQEDRDNIEQQSSSTESSAADSAQDAESTGTTLLGAFSAFVSALTNASPSNCNIDMDLGNLDLGVVNLCQLDLPQPIPSIASIMLILFCVPLSIATARKVINLFRSFQ